MRGFLGDLSVASEESQRARFGAAPTREGSTES